ncbi:GNAT family N-acetyltransferase [Flavobacteriaceae bacterium S0825]|uniref:GNAT family N-acetyltransferase n=1 Tax=Gaetbulibacter sp. S0825 TaxID=2720084 RepID=UPI00142F4E84|nr:GNAT family N-acetyltransferase [Gaetbulibacter sp. S0825]MCK0110362.1 GNAT family N-acetyltransferase [Flavobacteriaceae bacterium S0825]NIX65991.1 GNAT family N-acetyltransferase [Gaetbulibacter sp. S0825]
MLYDYKLLTSQDIDAILPLMQKFTEEKFTNEVLRKRFVEMFTQNYECAGIYIGNELIGICGMWFCTRHYSGKSVEVDHVFIYEEHRGRGLGDLFFNWIYKYVKAKGCEEIELNTYVTNHPSHKFYHNQGFKIYGYHFAKKL